MVPLAVHSLFVTFLSAPLQLDYKFSKCTKMIADQALLQ